MHVDLSDDEFSQLLIAMGIALSVATRQKDNLLVVSMLKLINSINRNNPNWTRYEVPNEHVNVTGCGSSV